VSCIIPHLDVPIGFKETFGNDACLSIGVAINVDMADDALVAIQHVDSIVGHGLPSCRARREGKRLSVTDALGWPEPVIITIYEGKPHLKVERPITLDHIAMLDDRHRYQAHLQTGVEPDSQSSCHCLRPRLACELGTHTNRL